VNFAQCDVCTYIYIYIYIYILYIYIYIYILYIYILYIYILYIYNVCIYVSRIITQCCREPNRAKPPDEGRSVPEGEPHRTKIAPLGQSLVAPGARLLAQSRYFGSASFTRSNDSNPQKLYIQIKYRYFMAKNWYFPLWCSVCFGHRSGRGARINILRELSY
jgi:hypothetical protein